MVIGSENGTGITDSGPLPIPAQARSADVPAVGVLDEAPRSAHRVGVATPPAILPGLATRAVHEDQTLTAPTASARSYLLLEQPGPWDGDPLATLPSPVSERLRAFSRANDVEIILIRRPDGNQQGDHTLFLASPDFDGLIVRRSIASLTAIGSLDLVADLARVRLSTVPPGWTESDSVVIVATHASPDQRQRGRGMAIRLAALDPDNVWESSHTAAGQHSVNALLLPSGHLHSPVDASTATSILDASWQGRVPLDSFQGRAHHQATQQIAEVTLRRQLGAEAEAAVEPIDTREVRVATGDDDGAITITRAITRWRVFPALVADVALARMVPDLEGEPTRAWRVIVDRSNLVGGQDEHLSVIEVADDAEPGRGAHAWDATHAHAEGPVPLPDPTVVAELSALAPGEALDLGCGSGRHALWLAAHGWTVTAVDFSRSGLWRMADEAGARQIGIRAELADLRMWTPGGRRYDLILLSHVQLDEPFQKVAPWLAPGGRIVVIGPAKAPGSHPGIDFVAMAARATGARLRVVRAGEVERLEDGRRVRDAIVIAERPL